MKQWDWEWDICLPRHTLQVEFRWHIRDWRVGFYVEPGFLDNEVMFVDVYPLPTLSVLFALYRRDTSAPSSASGWPWRGWREE